MGRKRIKMNKETIRYIAGARLGAEIRNTEYSLKDMRKAKTDEQFRKSYKEFQDSSKRMEFWKKNLENIIERWLKSLEEQEQM